jgi:hypothetical protein
MDARRDNKPGLGKSGKRPTWGLILLGAVVLAVAAIIFSAAGPDRSRTAEHKDANPYSVNPRNGATETTIPNADMPTAPKSR